MAEPCTLAVWRNAGAEGQVKLLGKILGVPYARGGPNARASVEDLASEISAIEGIDDTLVCLPCCKSRSAHRRMCT
jgi:hypothetical protein